MFQNIRENKTGSYSPIENRTNPVLVVLMLVLALTAIFENGFKHEIVYYSYLLTVPLAIYCLWTGRPAYPFFSAAQVPLILFVFFSGLTLFWTININETLSELYKIMFYVLLFYLTAVFIRPMEIKKLVTVVLLVGAVIALVGILLFLLVKSSRITSVFINANPFGLYLAMLSLLGFGIYGHQKTKGKLLALAIVLVTDALVLTGSRGSLLAYIFSFPVLWLALPEENRWAGIKKFFLLFLVIGVSVFILSMAAPWLQQMGWQLDTLDRLVVRDRFQSSTSVEGRLSFWLVAGNMIQERPWTGFGLGTYHLAYNYFRNNDHYWSLYTHNHYLQTWADTGFFALAAFLAFFVIFFFQAFRMGGLVKEKGLYWGFFGAGLAFLMHLVVDFSWNMPAVTMLFWVFLGGIIALQDRGSSSFFMERPNTWCRLLGTLILGVFLLGSGQQLVAFKIMQGGEKAEASGDFSCAQDYYNWACRIYPWRAEYFGKLADTCLVLSRQEQKKAVIDQTVNFYRQAINLSPYEYGYYGVLGRVCWQEGMPGAEDYLRQAVRLAGFKIAPYNDLGYYYLLTGRPRQAVHVFMAGMVQRPFAYRNAPGKEEKQKVKNEGVKTHLGLAKAYQELGSKTKAREQLMAVLQIDPLNQVAWREIKNYM